MVSKSRQLKNAPQKIRFVGITNQNGHETRVFTLIYN